MIISKHLSLAEVIRSESAKRAGISNMPTEEHLENFEVLAKEVFEPIREHFKVPIHISSGYRSKELNKLVKGSNTSDHCEGRAIDIDMQGNDSSVTNRMIFDYIKDNLIFSQLIFEFGTDTEPDWVHVSYNTKNLKKEILRAKKIKGKTIYLKY